MSEFYAIVKPAGKGHELGISELAMVDRTKTKQFWWTSNSQNLILKFKSKCAADQVCSNLSFGKARVTTYTHAANTIALQGRRIPRRKEELREMSMSQAHLEPWDDHKNR